MRGFLEGFRKWWEGYLGRLSRANEESFGSGKVDCCGLGKTAANRKRQ